MKVVWRKRDVFNSARIEGEGNTALAMKNEAAARRRAVCYRVADFKAAGGLAGRLTKGHLPL
jgi:hypothetical protein